MRVSRFLTAFLLAATSACFAQTSWQIQSYSIQSINQYPNILIRADFNNDGAPDLLVVAESTSVMLNDGHGKFLAPIFNSIVPYPGATVAVLDFDSDGFNDIVDCNQLYDRESGTSTYTLELWHGEGDGTFTLSRSIPIDGCTQLARWGSQPRWSSGHRRDQFIACSW